MAAADGEVLFMTVRLFAAGHIVTYCVERRGPKQHAYGTRGFPTPAFRFSVPANTALILHA